jgi:hypothetical protein
MIPYDIPFFDTVCEAEGGAYWMDDGAPYHTTPKVIGYFAKNAVSSDYHGLRNLQI